MPAAIANTPSTNAYAPQRNTRAVRVICGQANAKTPNAIAATPRNTKAHQLLVYTINMAFLLVQIQNYDPALRARFCCWPRSLPTSASWKISLSGARGPVQDCCAPNNP